MSAAGGGVAAATGFYYQYLATLSRLLDLLEAGGDGDVAVHLESAPGAAHSDLDIVDFAVAAEGDRLLEVVQVKSSAAARPLTAPETLDALLRMVAVGEADRYTLVTNAPLTTPTEKLAAALAEGNRASAIESPQVSPTTRERLTRCRIDVDERSALELRNSLRERLRRYRAATRHGVGYEAAGLLTGFLVSEIFERAGPRVDRVITLREVRELVLIDARVLASATGARWGVPLGIPSWVPDVRRSTALDSVVDVLRPEVVPDRVYACAITGLSGLGKTSLAATYSQEYADAYDFVLWIESESVDTIRASVAGILSQAQHRGLPPADDERSLQRALHHFLASHPGTWLAIFDGALTPQVVRSWLPAHGHGHVIVTTTHSAGWSQLPRFALPPMTESEALELVRLRLARVLPPDGEDDPRLIELVDALERWPLALELACAYILSISLELAEIPAYMGKLRTRALGDESLELLNYPRTLVAAINLCLDRIVDDADMSDLDDPHRIAYLVAVVLAYLASRRIPVQLALSTVLLEPDQKRALGPGAGVLEAANFELREVTRILMRQSLVTTDRAPEPAPPDDASSGVLATAWTVSTNEVVQEVIRMRVGDLATAPDLLERVVFHVQDWLVGYLDDRDFERVAIVEPHAAAVAGHVQRLGLETPAAAVLLGNLASAYHTRGLLEEAADLLERELALTDRVAGGYTILHVKIHQQLAGIRLDEYRPVGRVLEPIIAAIECIRAGPLAPASLQAEIANMLAVSERLGRRDDDPRVAAVQSQLRELLDEAGGTAFTDALTEIHDLILDDREADALARIQALSAEGGLQAEHQIQLAGLKLECLTWLRRWSEANQELVALETATKGTAYLGELLADQLLGCALAAATPAQFGDSSAEVLFIAATAAADRVLQSGASITLGTQARHAALRGFAAVLERDEETARRLVDQFRREDLERADVESTAAYEILHALTRSWVAGHRPPEQRR